MRDELCDFVIVGAGSAGCVLASRLSERGARVVLLEAGPRDSNPLIHMPGGLARLAHFTSINWNYETEPEPALDMRRLYWPRGRVLGGCSSINAMCYTRGAAADYDEWVALGATGWSYADVLPYFRLSERQARGPSPYHGADGPLSVEDLRYRNPLSSLFVDAAVEAGFPRTADFNGPDPDGFGFYQVTQLRGRRSSAATAYLHPVRPRRNLDVRTGCHAVRIAFEGDRAVGVVVATRGTERVVRADVEVILAAGAIGSPHLLLLSGVGPAADIEAHGIRVHADLPGVGQNLQDHLDFTTLQECRRPVTYDFGLLEEVAVALRYLLTRSGPGVTNAAEAGGFARSRFASDARPDLQFHFVPAQIDDHGRQRRAGHGYTLHACHLRPRSRGRITLRSARSQDPPRIFAGYGSDPYDIGVLVEGVQRSRQILNATPFDGWRGREVYPGDSVRTESDIEAAIRRRAQTLYHPVGTCRMGTDALAVTDPHLRVHGIRGLRVADASIMPRLIGGNTNAPTIMIAERAARLIADEHDGAVRSGSEAR